MELIISKFLETVTVFGCLLVRVTSCHLTSLNRLNSNGYVKLLEIMLRLWRESYSRKAMCVVVFFGSLLYI